MQDNQSGFRVVVLQRIVQPSFSLHSRSNAEEMNHKAYRYDLIQLCHSFLRRRFSVLRCLLERLSPSFNSKPSRVACSNLGTLWI